MKFHFAGLGLGEPMNATQQNMLVLMLLVGMAAVFAVLVGVLSSQTLREEGLRRTVKRWLGR
jgi:hypothetical protein